MWLMEYPLKLPFYKFICCPCSDPTVDSGYTIFRAPLLPLFWSDCGQWLFHVYSSFSSLVLTRRRQWLLYVESSFAPLVLTRLWTVVVLCWELLCSPWYDPTVDSGCSMLRAPLLPLFWSDFGQWLFYVESSFAPLVLIRLWTVVVLCLELLCSPCSDPTVDSGCSMLRAPLLPLFWSDCGQWLFYICLEHLCSPCSVPTVDSCCSVLRAPFPIINFISEDTSHWKIV